MTSLKSLLRFSIVLQVFVAAAWHFFQWFAWNDDMALVLRSGIGGVKVGWLVVWMSATLAAWIYLSVLMWKLTRGAALMYFLLLILMPLTSTMDGLGQGKSITGIDLLYYMNGAFILCLTTFTPLRRYFKVLYEPGGYEFLKNPKTAQRFLKIGAIFFLLYGMLMQPDKPRPKARCCTKCCSKKSESVAAQKESGETMAAPAQ